MGIMKCKGRDCIERKIYTHTYAHTHTHTHIHTHTYIHTHSWPSIFAGSAFTD